MAFFIYIPALAFKLRVGFLLPAYADVANLRATCGRLINAAKALPTERSRWLLAQLNTGAEGVKKMAKKIPIKKLPADHPLYKMGFILGVKRLGGIRKETLDRSQIKETDKPKKQKSNVDK